MYICLSKDKLTFILLDGNSLAGDVNVFFGEAGHLLMFFVAPRGLRGWRDRGDGGREGVPSQGDCPGSFAAHAGDKKHHQSSPIESNRYYLKILYLYYMLYNISI